MKTASSDPPLSLDEEAEALRLLAVNGAKAEQIVCDMMQSACDAGDPAKSDRYERLARYLARHAPG